MSSQDPREYLNDEEEAIRLAQDAHQARIWTAMPGIIQSVNLAAMTCEVQLAIQGVGYDDQGNENWQNISILPDVPICFPSGGGFTISFPLKQGDEVLVIFAARCIDSWWQNGGYVNKPIELRMHDLSDAFAIPGPRSQPRKVGGLSATDLQITNDAGVPLLTMDSSGNAVFTGSITAQQVFSDGEVTAQAGSSATKVELSQHVHTGGTLTGGLTGTPEPGT